MASITGDILGTGVSGLLAFQRNLATIGHNISNANTVGYSRQRVEMTARLPQAAGNGFIGTGVQVDSVQRIYNEYLTQQVRGATSANSQLQTYHQHAAQVDNLLADPNAGLNPSLQRFFNALNDLSNDPSSMPARQVVLSEARSLADRFHYLDQRLSDLQTGVNVQIRNSINDINALAGSIAKLNQQIVVARGQAPAQPPNDLLDQRDALLARLAEQVSVTAVPQDDGAVNVFVGNGQPLVLSGTTTPLSVVSNPYDAARSEVGVRIGASTMVISDFLTGGVLGGALDARSGLIDVAQNALGRVAIGLAAEVNAQHRLGQDLNGNINLDFFNTLDLSSPRVLTSSAALIDVDVSNVGALTTSDYRLDYDGANYTLTRLSDSTVVGSFAGFPQTIASEGLTLSLTAGTPAAGESFLIQPTRTAAKNIGVVLSDPTRIAAAGPLRVADAVNANGQPTNLGSGRISGGNVSSVTGLPLASNITLTFDPNAGGAGVPGFTVAGGPAGPLLYNPATEANGKTFSFPGYGDVSFSVAGVPASGDRFTLGNNTGAVGDNRNALSLAGLRTQLSLSNGTASLEGAYGQMVADVGATTRRADISRQAQQGLLSQVTSARDSIAAVNLDEEAANLLRFQQAYQAAAQVIAISDTIFQTLINAVRR